MLELKGLCINRTITWVGACKKYQCRQNWYRAKLCLNNKLDVHGSVHHSINYLEITNKMWPCIRTYYSKVSYCSTCFERHDAHHQELKNCICSLWFYIRLWLPAAVKAQLWQQPATTDVCKTRGCKYNFWAPDDERCVAWNMLSNKKRWNNKF